MDLNAAIQTLLKQNADVMKETVVHTDSRRVVRCVTEVGVDGYVKRVERTFEKPPELRTVQCGHIEGVIDAANALIPAAEKAGAIGYVGSSGHVAIYFDRVRRDEEISHALTPTPGWAAISKGIANMTQTALYELLRTHFQAGSVMPIDFLGKLKRMKMKSEESSSSSLGPGSVAVSAEVQREARFDGVEPPETVVLSGQVYDGMAYAADDLKTVTYAVEFALSIDLVKGQFTLVPLAGEIERARRNAMKAIAELIAKQTGIVVVAGAMD